MMRLAIILIVLLRISFPAY
ncbi:type I toxin-antitoxin system Ibs family toxin [Escherichia coli]|nr:type I toxin-antitoxin system Ibs family toxin [Escherichia coli]